MIKEMVVKRLLDNVDKVVSSRLAVRKPQGEAKQERKRGMSAPASKRPWLVWRGAVRTAATVSAGIVGFFFADKVPVLGDKELQGMITDAITSLSVIYFSSGAASDWLRLSPGRGL